MTNRRRLSSLLVLVLLSSALFLGVGVGPANAQEPGQLALCGELDRVLGFAGDLEIAVKDLRSRTEPNPPAVAEALDTLQNSTQDDLTERINATDVLSEFFGPQCDGAGRTIARTCAAFRTVMGTGGEVAVLAIKDLRGYTEPGPLNSMRALDVLQDAESEIPPSGTRPSDDEIQQAYENLSGYHETRCQGLDECFWVRNALDGPGSEDAASIVRGLSSPAPPGIDAALALMAGEIVESPFHDSLAEAVAQVESYFSCPQPGGYPLLPNTGPPFASPFASTGFFLIASGALALATRRRVSH